ncbi:Sporulation related domain-containing protein [Caloramator quimbayensis]|uniref:Sporulation related domain-containing protein n=1 Tax=Caloramator quimbayensis TaxID=1147123 RepID=A0A1T4XY18_9CLOT|nr:SPOR domain-containing protein [Caloramator quimbayensis]SKA94469.1 Sporulation related domain-containing protein [Caloramator quimbayensis]
MNLMYRQILSKVKSSKKIKAILMFTVVLPIAAIVFGSILAKCFIIPITKKEPKQEKETVVSANTNNHIYNIYYFQSGVFTSKANAEMLKKVLKEVNVDCAVVKDKDIYRVIAGISDNNDFEDLKNKFKNLKYDYVVKEIPLNLAENSDDAELIEYIKSVKSIIECQIKLSYINNYNSDTDNLLAEINKENEILKELSIKIMNSDLDKKTIDYFKATNDIIIQNIDKYLIFMKKNQKESVLENLANEIFSIKSLYDFIGQNNI